jgi:hypothetical protein
VAEATVRLKKLPRRGTWEVARVHVPGLTVHEDDYQGLFVVVERRSGLPRCMEALTSESDLSALLIEACRKDGHRPAGRPKTLRCPPSQVAELREAADALGAKLAPDTDLSVIDAAIDAMMDSIGGPGAQDRSMPFPAVDVWRPVLAELTRSKPWTVVDEHVVFQVELDDLQDWLCTVLGAAGKVFGLSLFPSIEDLVIFRAGEPGMSVELDVVSISFDPIGEVPPQHAAWCRSQRLVFDGKVPLLFDFDGHGMMPIPDDESEDLAAMVQAVLGLIRSAGRALATLQHPIAETIETVRGRMYVRAMPIGVAMAGLDDLDWDGPPAEPLVREPHQLFFEWTDEPGDPVRLCIQAAARDAQRIRTRLMHIEVLEVDEDGDALQLYAIDDGHIRWDLGHVPPEVVAALPDLDDLFGRATLLCALKGGAKRKSFRPTDLLVAQQVDVVVTREA